MSDRYVNLITGNRFVYRGTIFTSDRPALVPADAAKYLLKKRNQRGVKMFEGLTEEEAQEKLYGPADLGPEEDHYYEDLSVVEKITYEQAPERRMRPGKLSGEHAEAAESLDEDDDGDDGDDEPAEEKTKKVTKKKVVRRRKAVRKKPKKIAEPELVDPHQTDPSEVEGDDDGDDDDGSSDDDSTVEV